MRVSKQMVYGALTLLPGLGGRRRKSGGVEAASARYCYAVWLRHLTKASESGLDAQPETVAELGPGGSLGVGLAALLSGSAKYYALDRVRHAGAAMNLEVFDELVELFRRRAPIPDAEEFPLVEPALESYDFPAHILGESRMRGALAESRVAAVREAAANPGGGLITYQAPWSDRAVIERNSVDMIYSQAALEHVDRLPDAYAAMSLWLKPSGYVSHAVDFKSHDFHPLWDGHRTYGDLEWKLIRGNRPYAINRAPLSEHLRLLREQGFAIRRVIPTTMEPAAPRRRLARRFREISEDDRTTSSAFIQAAKTGGAS